MSNDPPPRDIWWQNEQTARNRESRDRWQLYAAQRQKAGELLTNSLPQNGKLLLLGAGNCNDTDLNALLQTFAEIHLVDLDLEALRFGVEQQRLSSDRRVVLHPGIDISGLAAGCAKPTGSSMSDSDIERAVATARSHSLSEFELQFDVAASIGLLSQLIQMLVMTVGAAHPRLMDLVAAVRLRHLELLLQSVKPGGRVVLITEVVSSSTYPALAQIQAATELKPLLAELVHQRNFFTGLNPFVLRTLWHRSPELSTQLQDVEFVDPWLWDFGPRVYLCIGFRATRAAPPTVS